MAFALLIVPMSVGCGSGSTEVIDQSENATDIQQEEEDYEKLMEETEAENSEVKS